MIHTATLYYFDTNFYEFLGILYSVFIYVLYSDFVSDCNLQTKILHKYNSRSNIGCGINVVFVPPEDGFT
jgi:hypothetical protein